VAPAVPVSHHELCFGCGTANLFGLQLELEKRPDDTVAGRFFVKQDHQGPPGHAHAGVIAAALDEAMSLAIQSEGIDAMTGRLEVDLVAPIPVGVFVRLEAGIERREGDRLVAWASAGLAHEEAEPLAKARGVLVRALLPPGRSEGENLDG
jgi:acyl-coenzyme A thioesterase PaaI-like protein